jgi:hypothetical protein
MRSELLNVSIDGSNCTVFEAGDRGLKEDVTLVTVFLQARVLLSTVNIPFTSTQNRTSSANHSPVPHGYP